MFKSVSEHHSPAVPNPYYKIIRSACSAAAGGEDDFVTPRISNGFGSPRSHANSRVMYTATREGERELPRGTKRLYRVSSSKRGSSLWCARTLRRAAVYSGFSCVRHARFVAAVGRTILCGFGYGFEDLGWNCFWNHNCDVIIHEDV